MSRYGVGGDAQFIGNLLDAHSLSEQVKDFTLPGSETHRLSCSRCFVFHVKNTAQVLNRLFEGNRGNITLLMRCALSTTYVL